MSNPKDFEAIACESCGAPLPHDMECDYCGMRHKYLKPVMQEYQAGGYLMPNLTMSFCSTSAALIGLIDSCGGVYEYDNDDFWFKRGEVKRELR